MAYSSSMDMERDTNRQFVIDATVESARKSTLVAYLLWFFLGGLGVHNFYLGKPVLAGLQLAGTLTYFAFSRMDDMALLLVLPIG